jgi:hypothetical protein
MWQWGGGHRRGLREPRRGWLAGRPDAQIGLTVDCTSVSDRVVAAILEHKSQPHVMVDHSNDTFRLRRIVSREWAIVARPPEVSTDPMLTDAFENLD